MSTLTKADLALDLSVKFSLRKYQAKAIVDSFFEEIALALEKGDEVKISGLGKFVTRQKKSRVGRNPKTGQAHDIGERTVVTFKQGHKLKVRVNKEEVEEFVEV